MASSCAQATPKEVQEIAQKAAQLLKQGSELHRVCTPCLLVVAGPSLMCALKPLLLARLAESSGTFGLIASRSPYHWQSVGDDGRNTDNAWVELVSVSFHDNEGVLNNYRLYVLSTTRIVHDLSPLSL